MSYTASEQQHCYPLISRVLSLETEDVSHPLRRVKGDKIAGSIPSEDLSSQEILNLVGGIGRQT
jgi:hypothetical protein